MVQEKAFHSSLLISSRRVFGWVFLNFFTKSVKSHPLKGVVTANSSVPELFCGATEFLRTLGRCRTCVSRGLAVLKLGSLSVM